MAGIEVTAFFADGNSEQLTWAASDAVSGGVTGTGWSLSLSGETFGDFDNSTNTLFGEWNLVNDSTVSAITDLSINAGIAGVYFDDLDTIEYTAGSDVGRPFASSDDTTVATFSGLFSAPDLFETLNIAWTNSLTAGSSYSFLTDTDKATVSEPATALVFLTGLLALVNVRRKS